LLVFWTRCQSLWKENRYERFEFAAPDFSPKTVRETRGYMDRSLLPTLGPKSLARLEPTELDAFYRRLLVSGGSGGRPLAPGTVRRIHGILRRALNQGVKWGWIGINPAMATALQRVPHRTSSRLPTRSCSATLWMRARRGFPIRSATL
jgi:hypothetical protein